LVPNIVGLSAGANICYLRTAADVMKIKEAYGLSKSKKVVIIGGGYIGLEIAASLKKLGASVVILERERRILSRVTSPEMSAYFYDLHAQNGVEIYANKQVVSVETSEETKQVTCQDGSEYLADLIIVGVGVRVNSELAESIGLEIENGIKVNEYTQTSDSDIYAIGDCTCHFNPQYSRYVRLESVQNAVDQGKVAAAAISGKLQPYDSIPWFWSDQYDTKLQIVGLTDGYDDLIMRKDDNQKRSVWYFKGEKLLSVDAINNAKAYVIGTKVIKENKHINKSVLSDISIPLNFDMLTS
jgi:3-phenylpropionate/trans-cinnamate dioxygenase ferredoxin reductase component